MSYSGSDIQIQIYLTLTECQAPQVAKHYIHCGTQVQIRSNQGNSMKELKFQTPLVLTQPLPNQT